MINSANDLRPRRVKKCESCKRKNVLAVRTAEDYTARCNKCGEDVGFVSSYSLCEHSPVHRYDEKAACILETATARKAKSKRVKEVFTTGELPHLWAHKVYTHGRNPQGNLFFRDSTIFSYGSHFAIARHVETKRGKAILFTTAGYSMTTNGHKSAVRQAIPDSVQVFNVAHVDTGYREDRHASNIKDYDKRAENALLKAIRARSSWGKESSYSSAVTLREERNSYVKFFGLRVKPLARVPELDSKAVDAIKLKENARKAVEARATKIENIEKAKQAAIYAEKQATAVEDWKAGIPNPTSLPYSAPTMLRISGDEVETSRGARIPLSHAKRALILVRAVVARGETWETNGHTCHVGHYKIERIEADGTIRAGCHVIARDEWERIAPSLDAIVAPIPTETETV